MIARRDGGDHKAFRHSSHNSGHRVKMRPDLAMTKRGPLGPSRLSSRVPRGLASPFLFSTFGNGVLLREIIPKTVITDKNTSLVSWTALCAKTPARLFPKKFSYQKQNGAGQHEGAEH